MPSLDPVAVSTQSDGRWKIAFVPTGSSAKSVAILVASPVKLLTYSFVAGGFNWNLTQATIDDKRLTLVQDLSQPGKTTETLDVKYVDSADVDSAAQILVSGVTGQFVVRRGIDNSVAWTIGQKVDIITFVAGVQRPDAPVENGLDTISQNMFITQVTQRQVTLVA